MPLDMFDRLVLDPGTGTLGELLQEREWAVGEIRRLRSDVSQLSRKLRTILESWQVVDLTANIAVSAARLGASLRMKLADAVQAASAINADALVTHDRDSSRIRSLRVLP